LVIELILLLTDVLMDRQEPMIIAQELVDLAAKLQADCAREQ
jgi:hypothetical protein